MGDVSIAEPPRPERATAIHRTRRAAFARIRVIDLRWSAGLMVGVSLAVVAALSQLRERGLLTGFGVVADRVSAHPTQITGSSPGMDLLISYVAGFSSDREIVLDITIWFAAISVGIAAVLVHSMVMHVARIDESRPALVGVSLIAGCVLPFISIVAVRVGPAPDFGLLVAHRTVEAFVLLPMILATALVASSATLPFRTRLVMATAITLAAASVTIAAIPVMVSVAVLSRLLPAFHLERVPARALGIVVACAAAVGLVVVLAIDDRSRHDVDHLKLAFGVALFPITMGFTHGPALARSAAWLAAVASFGLAAAIRAAADGARTGSTGVVVATYVLVFTVTFAVFVASVARNGTFARRDILPTLALALHLAGGVFYYAIAFP